MINWIAIFKRPQNVEIDSTKDLQSLPHNNNQQYRKYNNTMSLVLWFLLLNFELMQQVTLVIFELFLDIFKISKFLFWSFERETVYP